jgi:hypothetical protein
MKLFSWSVALTKAKRMQEGRERMHKRAQKQVASAACPTLFTECCPSYSVTEHAEVYSAGI